MTGRRYVTVDVFTDRRFGGNPLAVVLDAQGLTAAQMQQIATEFNYAETTFVLPARDARHAAHVRIYTSRVEVPFAGHPNVGTAFVLARELESRGVPLPEKFVFEEAAGLVPVRLLRTGQILTGAELTAPEPLSVGATVSAADAARCVGLSAEDIVIEHHPPQVLSVGLPFLVAQVASRDALRRARADLATHERVLPPVGTDAIYIYARGAAVTELHARMFSPIDACPEDPATGSATAATLARLACLDPTGDAEQHWRVEQGVELGRPSLLLGRTCRRDGRLDAVHVGGQVVAVMRGEIEV